MNNRGQVILFTLMFGLVIILLALALASPIKNMVDITRNDTTTINGVTTQGLGCDNVTILANETTGEFTKGTCVIADLYTPYFFAFLIVMAGLIITAKVLVG